MIAETAQDVAILLGPPLLFQAEPKRPFKLQTWHVVVGGVALVLIVCGAIYIYDHVSGTYKPADKDSAPKFRKVVRKEESV